MYGYIYKTTCLITNKIYVGQHKASTFELSYIGSGKLLKQAISKYGKANFIVELLSWCNTIDELNEKEIYYIKYFNSTNKAIGYNIEAGGKSCVMQDSTKEKLRVAHLGKKASKETKLKLSYSHSGSKNSFYGKHHSEETKKKIGAKSRGRQTFLNKHHKESSIEKMRKAKLGNVPTNSIKVQCVNDGIIYLSIAKAAKAYNISCNSVSTSIKENRALRNGLQFIKYI